MTSAPVTTAERIRALNDTFRRTFVGGVVVITAGVEAMPSDQRRSLLEKVRGFDAFTEDNDPYAEHDFGSVDEGGVRCFWKVDYYDRATEMGSPDPADPDVTTRVLTVMLAEEPERPASSMRARKPQHTPELSRRQRQRRSNTPT